MDAYVFKSALYCDECTRQTLFDAFGADPAGREVPTREVLESVMDARGYESESDYDSDELPKGPYADGGGESDVPQHCEGCGTFLENPLTSDGYDYVRELVADYFNDGRGNPDVLNAWIREYEIEMWVFMRYLPGCLPDAGPDVFFLREDAREHWRDEAERVAESEADRDDDEAESEMKKWEALRDRADESDFDPDYAKESAPDGYMWSLERETTIHT